MQTTANYYSGFKSKFIGLAVTALLLVGCSADEGPGAGASAAPQVSFSGSPTSVPAGGTTTFTYSAIGATGCVASGSWSGNKGTSGSEVITVPTAPGSYAYTLTCTGADGQTTANTVPITVTGSTQAGPAPSVSFTASPTSVAPGGTSTLTHNATGATDCVASGSWSGSKGTSGSNVVTLPTTPGSYAYTLTCTGSDGQTASNTQNITVTAATPSNPGLITGGAPGSVLPNDGTTDTMITEGGTPLAGNFVCTRSALAYGPNPVVEVSANGLVGGTVTDLVNMLGGSSTTQLLNSVVAKELVVDGNLDTFATVNQAAGLLSPAIESIDLIVRLNGTAPVGQFAVFGLTLPSGLLELSIMQDITVTTFTGTTEQESRSFSLTSLDLLGQGLTGTPAVFLGLKATQSFDTARISFTPAVVSANVANAVNVHELCTNGNFVTP